MARRIIFPIIIFFTLLAAANVRSVPLLVLAIAEIIFAALMIALAVFQRSRIKAEPVRSFLHLQKGEPYDCRIRINNSSPFPVSRFRLDLTFGYTHEDEKPISLYGGTDKDEGFLRLDLDNNYCGLNRLELQSIKCYDWFFLSAFSKKLNKAMQIAVLPDKALKINIVHDPKTDISTVYEQDHEHILSARGGTDPEDIRPYRQGDPVKHIYWKQSAKMNELWVREFLEDSGPFPVITTDPAAYALLSIEQRDSFTRIFHALLSGMLDTYKRLVFVHSFPGKASDNYLISEYDHIVAILICLYKEDFSTLDDLLLSEDISAAFILSADPDTLTVSVGGKPLKRFSADVTDDEINTAVLMI